jgi:hypothetical protein
MNALILRLVGGAFGLAMLASAAWLIRDRFHQQDLAQAAAACAVAAGDPNDAKPLDACLPKVAAEIRAARQGRICETSLLPSLRPETRFAMAQSCGAGVKRLVAQGDASAADLADARRDLAAARTELTTAVARAEARALRTNERERHGRTVIQAAPRDAGGTIRCNAECLRRLAGD